MEKLLMMVCNVLLGVLFINLCSFNYEVSGYSSGVPGAPNIACAKMRPCHGYKHDNKHKVFSISVTPNVIKPGSENTVTLEGKDGKTFKGFLIEARLKTKGSGRIGSFHGPSDTTRPACNDHEGLTHENNEPKNAVTFTWNAPNNLSNSDKVVFKATFVEDYYSYWMDQLELSVSSSSDHASAASENDIGKTKVKRYYM